MSREEVMMWFADDVCGPEKPAHPAIGWPKLAGDLTWAIQLLRFEPPQGMREFRDAVVDYYETLLAFVEERDRALEVDEALFMANPDVEQKRAAVVAAFNVLPEPDRQVFEDSGCRF